MDADDLARGRALEEAATPGPWGISERAWTGAVNAIGTDLATVIGAGKSARPEDAEFICWLGNHAVPLLDAAERAARLGELLLRCRPYLAGYRCESEQEGDDLAVLERDIHAALAQPKGARDG